MARSRKTGEARPPREWEVGGHGNQSIGKVQGRGEVLFLKF